jgi:predicted ATPase/class 3 adenylate cyclase
VPDHTPVTVFLFTDIEGSTRLWEQAPDAMRKALAQHDALAAESVTSHHGRVVKTTGDGIHAVFGDPLDAVQATIAMQVALETVGSDDLRLRVRAGLHLGVEAERDNDYYGASVNRAARIMSAAHGGQILVSDAVATLLRDRLPADIRLLSLGRVRLRDLSEPETVYQVLHACLRTEFPALRSLESTPNNLPHALTSFIGRENEVAEVCALLRATRLLTIFGIGGLGKSRLSLQVAAASLGQFPDGVWFVELAPVSDPRMVSQTLATVLGIRDDAGQSPQDAILKFVRDRKVLIVLDNCEHLTQACAEVAGAILGSGAGVTILATSRERLGIAGEQTYPLAPFAVPPRDTLAPGALSAFPSVRLFFERALSARPDFAITAENAGAVAAICQQLDGIPLALELAAARARSMSVQKIAERLSDRFRLLSAGDRSALPRQQTLRALIDWSYDLLSVQEQTLFRRLAVFAGGFTLEAAEDVTPGGVIARGDVQDILPQLVEKSLVMLDIQHDRYRMLETVRQYGIEKLRPGEQGGTRERFVAYYVDLCERAAPQMTGGDAARWLKLLDDERENVLAAHASCAVVESGGELDLRLVRALRRYCSIRGLFNLMYTMIVEALGRSDAQSRDVVRCRALSDAGQYALRMARHAEALSFLEESLAIAREIGDESRVAVVLQPMGVTYLALGQSDTARRYLAEALALARAGGDKREIAAALSAIEQLYRVAGDLEAAESASREMLTMMRELDDPQNIGVALTNLAIVAILRGSHAEASDLLREIVDINARLGGTPFRQWIFEVAAGIASAREDYARAAELFGAAEALSDASGRARDAADAAFVTSVMRQARSALGEEELEAAVQRGRSRTPEASSAMAEEISRRR